MGRCEITPLRLDSASANPHTNAVPCHRQKRFFGRFRIIVRFAQGLQSFLAIAAERRFVAATPVNKGKPGVF